MSVLTPQNNICTAVQACSSIDAEVFQLEDVPLADSPPLPPLPSLRPRPLPSRPDFILCRKRGKIREAHKLKCDGTQPDQETVQEMANTHAKEKNNGASNWIIGL